MTFGGRALFSIHRAQEGPKSHCLSNNSDVKPFKGSSENASKLKNKKRKAGRGGNKIEEDTRDNEARERGKHNLNFEDHVFYLLFVNS